LKNKRFFEKHVAERAPIPYTESVIRAGVLEQKFERLVSRSKPGGFHHGEEEEEDEDPEVIWPISPPLFKTGGEFDAVADAASARCLPRKGRPRAGPFAFEGVE
jgi:hypothetical protein